MSVCILYVYKSDVMTLGEREQHIYLFIYLDIREPWISEIYFSDLLRKYLINILGGKLLPDWLVNPSSLRTIQSRSTSL